MALNGWQRLLIVIVSAWVMLVSGLAALEYQAGQGEVGDGFFTCAEPDHPPTPPSARYWSRDCGMFSRVWIAKGLFDDLPPHQRYLNISWFLTILLGPLAFIGLCIVAFRWVVGGFRPISLKVRSEPIASRALPPAERPELSFRSHVERWLDRMPRRWARNAAIGGGLLAAPVIVPPLAKGDGAAVAFMLARLGLVALSTAGTAYICGLWARSSLKAPLLLGPASAIARITPNWVSGAMLLGVLVIASDVLFGWRKTTPLFAAGISFRDWGYLTGFFGTWILGGYLTALVSKRGLRKAIGADLRSNAERDNPSISYCVPLDSSSRAQAQTPAPSPEAI